jgi:uncharacterized protein (DUF1697 family)
MTRYAALLRAVNVAGNKLAMPDLRRILESLGARDVATYLQSGNAVFTGPRTVASRLEQALADELDVQSTVLLRSHAELVSLIEDDPFGVGDKTVSVTFLASTADADRVAAIDPDAYAPDRFVVRGSEVYLHTPGGYGRSKLGNAFWEKKLGVEATTRNWNTVVALAELTG